MAWTSTLPPDPIAAGWWHDAAEREQVEQREAADRALVVPALAARVRRAIRDIDEALATTGPCDCVAAGYRNGCVACRPEWASK